MKRKALTAATVAVALGAAIVGAGPATAHGLQGQGFQGGFDAQGSHMGPGMMGGHGARMMGGYGPGMMGGHGHGRMGGHGHGMEYGMSGSGPGGGDCPYAKAALADKELTVEDVTKILERRLAWMGNDRLKVGEVKAKDENTIIAEIVTVDDSLVRRVEFDRKTGRHHPVN